MFRLKILGFLALIAMPLAPAFAQFRPPGELRGAPRDDFQQTQGVDPAGLTVRIDRLEGQVRTLTGQLEQLQFANRKLEDQLKKFQQDVEFRFQDSGGKGGARPGPQPAPAPAPGRRTERLESPGMAAAAPTGETTPLASGPATRLSRRGDAFDPDANPDAPGAPRQLGNPGQVIARAPGAPMTAGPLGDDEEEVDLNAPIDLMRRGAPPVGPGPAPAPLQQGQALPPPAGQQVATIPPPPSPREEYDRAAASLRGGQFEAAEGGFRSFLQKYPKDKLIPDATYNLGESYFRRQRAREAAEQFLKVSTDYPKSIRAPEALVKLGLSLEKIGAKEQACAAYGEVGRKYPNANATVRASAERESKRAQC